MFLILSFVFRATQSLMALTDCALFPKFIEVTFALKRCLDDFSKSSSTLTFDTKIPLAMRISLAGKLWDNLNIKNQKLNFLDLHHTSSSPKSRGNFSSTILPFPGRWSTSTICLSVFPAAPYDVINMATYALKGDITTLFLLRRAASYWKVSRYVKSCAGIAVKKIKIPWADLWKTSFPHRNFPVTPFPGAGVDHSLAEPWNRHTRNPVDWWESRNSVAFPRHRRDLPPELEPELSA